MSHLTDAIARHGLAGLIFVLVFAAAETGAASGPRAGKTASGGLTPAECVEAIRLFEVVRGSQREVLVKACDLVDGRPLTSPGYISGVELTSSKRGLQVGIEGAARSLSDGGEPPVTRRLLPLNRDAVRGAFGRHRYAYFPEVPGDAVLEPERFEITIRDGGRLLRLPVHHQGYREIAAGAPQPPRARGKIRFRYAGDAASDLRWDGAERQMRLQAITAGIEHVERALDAALVDEVAILDWKGAHNALTRYGQSRIWFYADTFWGLSPEELKCAAEHEALHLFGDRQAYAENARVRELFADLHGFGPLSLERFTLVAAGKMPPAPRGAAVSGLLAFIDEGNFIEGMSGGHAGDNLDEFATSFLHSLLYLDRLAPNLERLGRHKTPGTAELPAKAFRQAVLQDYRRCLEAFRDAAGQSPPLPRDGDDPVLGLLEKGLRLSVDAALPIRPGGGTGTVTAR